MIRRCRRGLSVLTAMPYSKAGTSEMPRQKRPDSRIQPTTSTDSDVQKSEFRIAVENKVTTKNCVELRSGKDAPEDNVAKQTKYYNAKNYRGQRLTASSGYSGYVPPITLFLLCNYRFSFCPL